MDLKGKYLRFICEGYVKKLCDFMFIGKVFLLVLIFEIILFQKRRGNDYLIYLLMVIYNNVEFFSL